jgi:hypothetical protein
MFYVQGVHGSYFQTTFHHKKQSIIIFGYGKIMASGKEFMINCGNEQGLRPVENQSPAQVSSTANLSKQQTRPVKKAMTAGKNQRKKTSYPGRCPWLADYCFSYCSQCSRT